MVSKVKTVFITLIGVVTLTDFVSLERNLFFTHGLHTSTSTVTRIVSSNSLATKSRTKTPLCIPGSVIARSRTISLFPLSSSSILSATNAAYGKGAEISPECNKNEIKISDSFPDGIIPKSAAVIVEQNDNDLIKDPETNGTSISKVPVAIASALLVTGMVRPMDVALVASWTAYFTILNMTARSARDDGTPTLPALPMQGHIPVIISNPLGKRFDRSSAYRRWLKLGAFLGLIGPLAWLFISTVVRRSQGAPSIELEAARLVTRPLFLMCCQAVTEAISKQKLIPLPLRILIPLVYNSSRLVYLWHWAFDTTIYLGTIGRCLGIANVAYLAINLFVFLIPIASLRYLRAHFFGVEAEEVTARSGIEETLGLVPSND